MSFFLGCLAALSCSAGSLSKRNTHSLRSATINIMLFSIVEVHSMELATHCIAGIVKLFAQSLANSMLGEKPLKVQWFYRASLDSTTLGKLRYSDFRRTSGRRLGPTLSQSHDTSIIPVKRSSISVSSRRELATDRRVDLVQGPARTLKGIKQRPNWLDDAALSVPADLRHDVKSILEKAQRAAIKREITTTHFLSSSTGITILRILESNADEDVAGYRWGGYEGAERAKLLIGLPDKINAVDFSPAGLDLLPPEVHGVAALEINGKSKFGTIDHEDILGSLRKAGVSRRELGDILILPEQRGAIIFVSSHMVPFLQMELTKIGRIPVKAELLDWKEVFALVAASSQYQMQQEKLFYPEGISDYSKYHPQNTSNTVLSWASGYAIGRLLRFDDVASAVFRLEKSEVALMIRKGTMQLNGRVRSTNAEVIEGDVLSAVGKGRTQVIKARCNQRNKFRIQFLKLA